MPRLVIALLLCLGPALSEAVEVRFQKVAENVYVHVGDVGARTVQNEALNANIGLVVAPGGAIVIDPGATDPPKSVCQFSEAAHFAHLRFANLGGLEVPLADVRPRVHAAQ
jgi:hypothetical protein